MDESLAQNNRPPKGAGYVHSIETGGTVDGPGMRFVVFVSGCPLRCLYCHNPDTRNIKTGTLRQADELAAEAARYADFMRRTGGGVTITGGEPLYQADFVTEVFRECKKRGLHTALDTSGFLGRKTPEALLDVTDLVLLDIKSFDPVTYKRVTSVWLEPTLDFARMLAEKKKPVWIRCVLVPNLTDNLDAFEGLADFLKECGNVEKVEILPFHKMGEAKWKALGFTYELSDTPPPAPELVRQVRAIFEKRGLVTV